MTEDKKSFVMYKNWGDFVSKMTDEEAGQLLKAIYALEVQGEEVDPENRVAALIYGGIKGKLLEDIDKYAATCDKRAEASAKGIEARRKKEQKQPLGNVKQPLGNEKQPNGSSVQPNGNQMVSDTDTETDTENETDTDKEGESPLPPFAPTVAGLSVPDVASLGVPAELQEKVSEWVSNKAARNETLTEAEFKSFVSKVKANARKYGASEVADLIEECMSNGYKGVTWDRLEKHARDKPENSYLYRIDHRLDVVDKWAEEVGAFEEETQ